MNFVQNLEECLRDLAVASRQRHPGVKEASERAVMKLRLLQSGYVSAVRKASTTADHPTTSLFKSSDLLHPFLLAANYPNADFKLLEISFRAMRLLMEGDALIPTDAIHMVRVYQIQAHVVTAYYQNQYAKEIQKTAMSTLHHAEKGSSEQKSNSTSSHSSWFSWSGNRNSAGKDLGSQIESNTPLKNAVSSSRGKTGQAALSGPLLEKLALEILSSLLQLLQLLRNYPKNLTEEVWTNSVSLACLWFYLPPRHTIQQAAHSTLSQIVSLLFQTDSKVLIQHTWEDLLALTSSDVKKSMSGIFKLCKRKTSDASAAALPPSPEFALELMAQLLKETSSTENQFQLSDSLLVKSMGVTVTLLEHMSKASIENSLRVVQWTLILLQSHTKDYSIECRELFLQLIKQIPAATDACRKHHDFEDGFMYISASENISSEEDPFASSNKQNLPEKLTVFPPRCLWRAGIVLEATYHLLNGNPAEMLLLFGDRRIVQSLAEALSDFATIGTSCKSHVMQVISFCQTQSSSWTKPTIFRKVEQAIVAGLNLSDRPSSSGEKDCDKKLPYSYVLGEGIWLSLQAILQLGEFSQLPDTAIERKELLHEIFSPSLAVAQHVLKRLPGCKELVALVLNGYSILADATLPFRASSVESKVLLTSLSKLSLPTWGRNDSQTLLRDQHVRALLCLLGILHRHVQHISDWEILLRTFEELSTMDIASPLLSDEAYHASFAVSASYPRFVGISTCITDDSLHLFLEALKEICEATMTKRDIVGESDTVLPDLRTSSDDAETATSDDRASISGKLLSIGVRAIYGNGDNAVESEGNLRRTERIRAVYYHDYLNDFVGRLTSAHFSVRLNAIGRIPFALVLLADVAMANTFRSKDCGAKIFSHFIQLADVSQVIRPLVMDVTTLLIMSQLSASSELPALIKGRSRIAFPKPMHSQLLAVESLDGSYEPDCLGSSQAEVLLPLCRSIEAAEKPNFAKAQLEVLNTILEGTGQNLSGEVWSLMINTIASLSGDPFYKNYRADSQWAECCLMAFRSLKLIVDDFFNQLPRAPDTSSTAHRSLLDCCSSFAVSRHDINTSLTAIGLLWTIADQDSALAAIDQVLSKLVLLSSDDRSEVRNASVNTLFSCIAGRGASFSASDWKSCITDSVFGVYEIVTAKVTSSCSENGDTHEEEATSKYNVKLHYSRDSAGKMWIATQVLVLRGLNRVLRIFFPQLLSTVNSEPPPVSGGSPAWWFEEAWTKILAFALHAASQASGRDNLEIRLIGVELLVVCCQLASEAGIQASVGPAKVSPNMEVVNGALRNVRESSSRVSLHCPDTVTATLSRRELFLKSFDYLVVFETNVIKERPAEDDTDQQVLCKFCGYLAKLYECTLENEFEADSCRQSTVAVEFICGEEVHSTEPSPEDRFVAVVNSVLKASCGDTNARFLNQGQKAALDLLRTMASHGSSCAFEELVRIAGASFFIRKESDGEESENTEEDMKHVGTLLMFEAASFVSQEITGEKVADECKILVLYRVLSIFFSDRQPGLSQRRYYKRFVPIILNGIISSSRLADMRDEYCLQAVDKLWIMILEFLNIIHTPVPLGKDMIKIPRVSEVLQIVTCSATYVPVNHASDLSMILSEAAHKVFDASKYHVDREMTDPKSEFARKSKKHKDDLLKLFYTCFLWSSSLQPETPTLLSLAVSIFDGTLCPKGFEEKPMLNLFVEASLLLCRALEREQEAKALVILLMPNLCQIIVSGDSTLKNAAGKVLLGANIAQTITATERRAVEAEKRVHELESVVSTLRNEIHELQSNHKKGGLWTFD